MPKAINIDEISVVKFFETGPIEKAEVVFNIVREKMRERLRGQEGRESQERGPVRKRRSGATEVPRQEVEVAPNG